MPQTVCQSAPRAVGVVGWYWTQKENHLGLESTCSCSLLKLKWNVLDSIFQWANNAVKGGRHGFKYYLKLFRYFVCLL